MRVLLLSIVLAVAGIALPVSAQAVTNSYSLNIPRQPLDKALKDLAQQTGMQIARFSDTPGGSAMVGPLSGDMSVDQALTSLLTTTGLTYKVVNDHTIAVTAPGASSGPEPAQVSPSVSKQAQSQEAGPQDKEGKKRSSDGFRVAQATPGKTSKDASVGNQDETASQKKLVALEEVVVTGSRIPLTAKEASQEVKIYSREQIEQSGQTTVSDFLNTLPDVSVSINEANGGFVSQTGSTTVQLHGLPIGTTLVLINGRRLETTGLNIAGNYFDLNNIPLSAIERIEVVSEGSSAVYGSDAIAGVVNFILRRDFSGFEASTKYGWTSEGGADEWNSSLAWGQQWGKGSLSIIASGQSRNELPSADRALTANSDFTAHGGQDNRVAACNPGNVFSVDGNPLPGLGTATFAAVPSSFSGKPTQQEFVQTAGTLNKCTLSGSVMPATERQGLVIQGHYELTTSTELFTELLASHVRQSNTFAPPILFGQPEFSQFTVGPSNPFNPFGETVGVGYQFTNPSNSPEVSDTIFVRPLIGLKGDVFSSWRWELSAWEARDRSTLTTPNTFFSASMQAALDSSNAATALNPFVAGAAASSQLLESLFFNNEQTFVGETRGISALLRGTVVRLPSGPVEIAVGSEYDRDSLSSHDITATDNNPANLEASFHRDSYAVFGEARIPILGSHGNPGRGDTLAVTAAGRFDRYSDFGRKTTPQLGAEWRPTDTLLVRGSYSKAFKAPSLFSLDSQTQMIPGIPVSDPLRGNQVEPVTVEFGGNPNLKPETGQSRTFGFVYSSQAIPDLRLAVTHWSIDQANSIVGLNLTSIVQNENALPGAVTRAATCVGGPPCPITLVNASELNFGNIKVSGLDYQVSYQRRTSAGTLTPAIAVTQTYYYRSSLIPGTPVIDKASTANDDGIWAPRWKGTASLGWVRGAYAANVLGRYVGLYQDYDSTRNIGNFWLCDANLRIGIGDAVAGNNSWLRGTFFTVGAVNVFNRLPQYSNYGFGTIGFDPAEADIRGRFLYAQLGAKW